MSATLYSSETTVNGGDLEIDMNVHGTLFLSAYSGQGNNGGIFTILPNEEGLAEAEKIISAIQSWIEHTKNSTKNET